MDYKKNWERQIKALPAMEIFNHGTLEMYHGGSYPDPDTFCGACWKVLKNEIPGERLIDWNLYEEDIREILECLNHYKADTKHPDYIFLQTKLSAIKARKMAQLNEGQIYSEIEITALALKPNGNRLEIDQDFFIGNYAELKQIMKNFDGKYSKNGFEFPYDATKVLDRIRNKETTNLKKTFQFFGTPKKQTGIMCEKAFDPYQNKKLKILEPSAGQGAIIDAVLEWFKENAVHVEIDSITGIEYMEENFHMLQQKYVFNPLIKLRQMDFLEYDKYINYFDVVIANPPFSKNQDIKHFMKMYEVCAPGGIVVSIMSNGFLYNSGKVHQEFRNFLGLKGDAQDRYAAKGGCTAIGLSKDGHDQECYIQTFEAGEFKESGTNVHTALICLRKNGISGFESKPELIPNKKEKPIVQQFNLFD